MQRIIGSYGGFGFSAMPEHRQGSPS